MGIEQCEKSHPGTFVSTCKIVFNSETELTLDGKICNVIFKHMRIDEAYNGFSDEQKKEYRKRLWVVWRDLVSRNLDQKRHNQKGIMRSLFWGKCKDVWDTDTRINELLTYESNSYITRVV